MGHFHKSINALHGFPWDISNWNFAIRAVLLPFLQIQVLEQHKQYLLFFFFFCSAMIPTKTVWGSLRFCNTATRLEPSMIYTEIYQRSRWWHPWSSCWRQMYVHRTMMMARLHFASRLAEWLVPQGTKRHVLQISSSDDFIAAYCSMFLGSDAIFSASTFNLQRHVTQMTKCIHCKSKPCF